MQQKAHKTREDKYNRLWEQNGHNWLVQAQDDLFLGRCVKPRDNFQPGETVVQAQFCGFAKSK